VGIITVILNLALGWFVTQDGSMIDKIFRITMVFSITNTFEALILIVLLKRTIHDITLIAKPINWLLSIVGMVVIWLGSQFVLPTLPIEGATTPTDWLVYAAHISTLAAIFVWGLAWGSNGFALIRPARQRSQDD
jgi:hypothetical protein